MSKAPSDKIPEEEIDIKRYLIAVLYNWPWFILSITLAIVVVFFINRYKSPTYSANTTLIIQDDQAGVKDVVQELGWNSNELEIGNELAFIKSYSFSRTVLENLKYDVSYYLVGDVLDVELYSNSPFTIEYDSLLCKKYLPVEVKLIDSLKYSIKYEDYQNDEVIEKECYYGQTYSDDYLKFKLFLRDTFVDQSSVYKFVVNDLDLLALDYQERLVAGPSLDAPLVVNLSINGKVPLKLIDYVNGISQLYINKGLEEKNKVHENTIAFIDQQLKGIVDSLSTAEKNLENFRQNNNIIDLGQKGNALFSRLQSVEEQKSVLDLRMKYYDYLLEYVEEKKDFQDIIVPSIIGIQDPLLNSLVSRLSQMHAEQSLIEFNSPKENPNLAIIKMQIENTRDALVENLKNVKNGALIEFQDIAEKLQKIEGEIKRLPSTERKMINIQRKFELNNNIYTFLLEKRAEAGIAKASNMPKGKVIDKAIPVRVRQLPSKQNSILIAGILIAMIIPVVVIVLIVLFDNKINEIKDVEAVAKMPIVGLVPHNDKNEDLVVLNHSNSQITESYRTVRSNLKFLVPQDRFIIAVSSTISGEGKTFNALNIASVYSLAKKKTILVGLDLRKPKLHQKFKFDNTKGATTVLIGKDKWRDCRKSVSEFLDFLPSGPISPNPAELMESKAMYNLLKELKEEYDAVILDTPPLAIISDAMLLQKEVDATVYVVRQKYSSKSVLNYVNDLCQEEKLHKPALLINDVDIKARYAYTYGRYGKGYGSYGDRYYGGYGGYYGDDKKQKSFLSKLNFFKQS